MVLGLRSASPMNPAGGITLPRDLAACASTNRARCAGASPTTGRAGARLREATADPTPLRLAQQTVVLWGEADPVAPSAWADRLPEFFLNLTVRLLPGVGHFVPVEAPDDAIGAIRAALAATPS